jgi:hypothetical protein
VPSTPERAARRSERRADRSRRRPGRSPRPSGCGNDTATWGIRAIAGALLVVSGATWSSGAPVPARIPSHSGGLHMPPTDRRCHLCDRRSERQTPRLRTRGHHWPRQTRRHSLWLAGDGGRLSLVGNSLLNRHVRSAGGTTHARREAVGSTTRNPGRRCRSAAGIRGISPSLNGARLLAAGCSRWQRPLSRPGEGRWVVPQSSVRNFR